LTLPKANETLVKAYNLLKNASTHNQFVRSLCFTSLNVTLVDLKESLQYYEEVKYIQALEYVKIFNEALDYCTQVVELKEGNHIPKGDYGSHFLITRVLFRSF